MKIRSVRLVALLLVFTLIFAPAAEAAGSLRVSLIPGSELALTCSGDELLVTGAGAYESLALQLVNAETFAQTETLFADVSDGAAEFSPGALEDGAYYVNLYVPAGGSSYISEIYFSLWIFAAGGELSLPEAPALALGKSGYPTEAELGYLSACHGTDDTEYIRSLSAQITAGMSDKYEKFRAICRYVAENISYDNALAASGRDTSTTGEKALKSGVAVCTGYSAATVALARAAGIACRCAYGFSANYGYEADWAGSATRTDSNHVWVEAYIGGRAVIADPTWNSRMETDNGKPVAAQTAGELYFDSAPEYFAFSHLLSFYESMPRYSGSRVADITVKNVPTGSPKTAAGLCLPNTVQLELFAADFGRFPVSVPVVWDVAACSYSAKTSFAQSFTVIGSATVPSYVSSGAGKTLVVTAKVTTVSAGAAGFAAFTARRAYDAAPFTDVSERWYKPYIASAYEFCLIDGMSAVSFAPAGTLTVAQAVKLAACVHSVYTTGGTAFAASSPWYAVYADYAVKHGIIAAGEYENMSRAVTRGEFAQIFAAALPAEALTEKNSAPSGSIADVPMSLACADAVYLLYRAGVLGGDAPTAEWPSGRFRPYDTISRAEAAAVLVRLAVPDKRL